MNVYVPALAKHVESQSCLFSKARLWHLDNEQDDKAQRAFGQCLQCKCQESQECCYHGSQQEMQGQPRQVFGIICHAYTRHKWDTQQEGSNLVISRCKLAQVCHEGAASTRLALGGTLVQQCTAQPS
jgi:hypothetical protein